MQLFSFVYMKSIFSLLIFTLNVLKRNLNDAKKQEQNGTKILQVNERKKQSKTSYEKRSF